MIPADDGVRLFDLIIEELNLEPLYRVYSDTGRKPATSPKAMLKVIVYANMEGIYAAEESDPVAER